MFQLVNLRKMNRTKAIERILRKIRTFIKEEGKIKSIHYIEELDAILISSGYLRKDDAIDLSRSIERGDLV